MSKKKLLFIYIEDFFGFHKKEFNFSTKEQFCIQTNNQLSLEKLECEKTLPEKFWGQNISDISIFIGDNGSGKTRVIKIICQWICQLSHGIFPQERGILVFQEDDYFRCIGFEKGKILKVNVPEIVHFMDLDFKEYFNDLKVIYFSHTMTELNLDTFNVLFDYSMSYRMKEANNDKNAISDDIIANYKQYEFNRQYEIFKEINNKFSINYIQMEIRHTSFVDLLPKQYNYIKKDLSEFWNYYFGSYVQTDSSKDILLGIELLQSIFIGVITKLLKWEQTNTFVEEKGVVISVLENLVSSTISDNANIEDGGEWIKQFLKDLFLDCRKIYKESSYRDIFLKNWEKTIEQEIDKFITIILSYIKQDSIPFLEEWKLVSMPIDKKVSIRLMKLEDENKKIFQNFWEVYKNIAFYMENICFSWSASSGEQNWMNLFSVLCDGSLSYENVWLFLDEPDITFHMEWKRILLMKIIEICESYCYNQNVQVWISTHSPIMLSDMPKASVIYLDEKKEDTHPDTFGQNIYVLFNDAFYMRNGAIGAFAGHKIVNALKKLKALEYKLYSKEFITKEEIDDVLDEFEKEIDIVAEPIFKGQMRSYLTRCKKLAGRE